MAEGTEKDSGESCVDHQTNNYQSSPPLKTSSLLSITLSTPNAKGQNETESDTEVIKEEPDLIKCVNSASPESKNLLRERSKTPPATISQHYTTLLGFGETMSLKKTEEKSRDSGVHLDDIHIGSSIGSATNSNNCSSTGVLNTDDDRESGNGDGGGEDPSRRHSKSSSLPHGVKLCPENNSVKANANGESQENGASGDDKWVGLEEELKKAQTELREKDAEVEVLKGIRQQVEGELEDLTASLFEEAHKMVKEAKMKEASSEKSLKEAKMQLEGLQAEVAALKALLITSTPSRPNLGGNGGNGISLFKKQHKRCPSHNHLQYGRPEDESNGTEKEKQSSEVVIDRARCDVDPILLSHFAAWRVDLSLNREKSPFLQKMYTEDIDPCLSFADESLVIRLKKAIEENSIWVEPLPEKDRNNVPKECALLRCPRVCHYRMRFAFDSPEWFDISQICRDRIAAVCEFLNYLRYIKNGLVKASVEDAYWEMLRLRKQLAIAKLGISIS